MLVLDNGSTDGTVQMLEEFSRADPRIQWRSDPGPLDQVAARTKLARDAFRQGAAWVVPFDADEFWWVNHGDLRSFLAASAAGALRAQTVLFVQDRTRQDASEDGLLTMTRRAPIAVAASPAEIEERKYAYIETRRGPKWVFRPSAEVVVRVGNHNVSATAGAGIDTRGLECLHAPLRSRACLERKADHGERAIQSESPPKRSWHLKRWARLRAEGELDLEWAANSYVGTSLDVFGNEHPLIEDLRLRNIVAPYLANAGHGSACDSAPPGSTRSPKPHGQSRDPEDEAAGQSTTESSPVIASSARPALSPICSPDAPHIVKDRDDPWRPSYHAVKRANERTIAFLKSTSCRVIAEVGVYEGYTSRKVAEYLDGRGELHLFDFADRIEPIVAALNQAGYDNVVGHGNSRKLFDSYNWSLMRLLQQHPEPIFDYVFLDGAHVWALDALAFVLLDRLLKPGGYIDFDDYRWSLAKSPSLNPVAFPPTAEMYTDEQIAERQVKLVVDLLVRRDPRYVEVVKNKIFKKLPEAHESTRLDTGHHDTDERSRRKRRSQRQEP